MINAIGIIELSKIHLRGYRSYSFWHIRLIFKRRTFETVVSRTGQSLFKCPLHKYVYFGHFILTFQCTNMCTSAAGGNLNSKLNNQTDILFRISLQDFLESNENESITKECKLKVEFNRFETNEDRSYSNK
jgi:hypothetical protein